MNHMQSIVRDICSENNIEYRLVSKDWIMILKYKNKIRYIVGYKFDLNNHAVGQICDDKYALYDVLKQFHIPVAEHHILFKKYDKDEVLKYAKKYEYNLVVKSNSGTCGNDMFHTLEKKDLFISIDKLFEKHDSISISPYYEIKNEYRTIILNDKVELVYGKRKPIVIGNGKNTIYELLCEFNEHYFKDLNKNQDLERILKDNELYEFNWQFNLSKGSIPFFIKDKDLEEKLKEIALQTAKVLNLNFASIDMIELETGQLLVLEANSGIMMENFIKIIKNGKDTARKIYTKAIEEMFK